MDISLLKKLYQENRFRPDKRLGQNFMVDANIRKNILKALPVDYDTRLVEIGPGFGVMTFDLADMVREVTAVEKDSRLCDIMSPYYREKGNICLVHADFLDVPLGGLDAGGAGLFVFGNIPYYITTPIIEKVIRERAHVSGLYMVIQEELADRLVAAPGSRTYGSISCFVRFYAHVRKLFRIKKNSFFPRPDVPSCLIGLDIREEPAVRVGDEQAMFHIIRTAFGQRRKKAVNPLSASGMGGLGRGEWLELFSTADIDPASRAEAISLREYARLTDAFLEMAREG
jgi:16S rRNA (adenine1518-N6/adenine1519-N6)-dimethyltransferase